eukprot:CAMPEP_0167747210 /NCGR_PEP_ID=MMETSP0110_2-20121227/4155_1 /TAXON_ID=629695 /ORGANISM="Gymnochlora sp., Strain CCMP2014" /LENGTH=571 /DNA_ID=CAMNT_0007632087 /DNA_START=57 /DNA_END=1768 /DNA_ORIENTATION=-
MSLWTKGYSQVSKFVDRNKVTLGIVATAAGSLYVYQKFKPYAEDAKMILSGIYHVAKHGLGMGPNLMDGKEGEHTRPEDTPLGKQFEKLLRTGDRLVEIQVTGDLFPGGKQTDALAGKENGLYEKLSKLFDLKTMRGGLKTGKKNTDQYQRWNDFMVAGISQTFTALYSLILINVTTKAMLSIFHRHGLHSYVRNQSNRGAADQTSPEDIENLLTDPRAFEAFIKHDSELTELCSGLSFEEATKERRVLAKIIDLYRRGGPALAAASSAAAAVINQEEERADIDAAGRHLLALLDYCKGEGLEKLSTHISNSVRRCISRRGLGFQGRLLSWEQFAALLDEIALEIESSAMLESESRMKREEKCTTDEKSNAFEDAWTQATADAKNQDSKGATLMMSIFAFPSNYRRDLSHESLLSMNSRGDDIKGLQPLIGSQSSARMLGKVARSILADMVAELREVVATSTFEAVIRTNRREVLDAFKVLLKDKFTVNKKGEIDLEAKMSSIKGSVKMAKICKAILPQVPPAPADPGMEGEKIAPLPPVHHEVMGAVRQTEAVRKLCQIVFFPMDGRKNL